MSASTITWTLAVRHNSPFHARRHIAVVPNVSWGLIPWEADLLVLSKARYLSEIEIKISMADWKADLAKTKFRPDAYSEYERPEKLVKFFWYAAPPELAKRFEEVGIADTAGVLSVGDNKVDVLRYAKANPKAEKFDDDKTMKLLRLSALKAWRMAYDPALEEKFAATMPTEDCPDAIEALAK